MSRRTVQDAFAILGKGWAVRYYRLWVVGPLAYVPSRPHHFAYMREQLAEARACPSPRLP